jgi:dihydrodipicolinate synthase/N-acetylneuraminate lyase
VVEVFADQMSRTPDARAMVGVIGLSTGNVLERIRVAHDIGIREFQISFPMWQTLTEPEVLTYLQEICGAFPDSLFMHYNTARVGRVINGYAYRPIVAAIPNLVATKTLTSDLVTVGNVVREAPELMHFLSEQSIVDGALFGEVGLLGTFGSLAPKKSWAVWEAANAGRYRDAAKIGAWFERMSREIFDALMVDRRVDGAYDKTIEKLSPGLDDFPLRMLSPYRTISDDEFQQAQQILRDRFPDCE